MWIAPLFFCDDIGLICQDLRLALQQVAMQQLLLYIFKAKALDGIREPFSVDALVTEQQETLFHDFHNLVLGGKNRVEQPARRNLLAPASADINAIAVGCVVTGMERTFAHAASAMGADFRVNMHFAVDDLGSAYGTGLFTLALAAATALICVKFRYTLAHDAHIIQVRLDAVVRAAAYGNLEFVGQGNGAIADEKPFMQFFGNGIGIQQAILAGGTLAGDNWAYLFAGTAGLQAAFCQEGTQRINFFKGNLLDFHGQAGGKAQFTVAEFVCGIHNALHVFGGDFAVAGDDTAVEQVGALAVQAAQGLDTADLLLRDGSSTYRGERNWHGEKPSFISIFLDGKTLDKSRMNFSFVIVTLNDGISNNRLKIVIIFVRLIQNKLIYLYEIITFKRYIPI